MTLQEQIDTFTDWLPGQKERILGDFEAGLIRWPNRSTIGVNGLRDMGIRPNGAIWHHNESFAVTRDGIVVSRGPAPEDPSHFAYEELENS